MVNTKIRLIIFFAAEDGEPLHSQQKQDRDLTVAQIMNSLLQNSLEEKTRNYVMCVFPLLLWLPENSELKSILINSNQIE